MFRISLLSATAATGLLTGSKFTTFTQDLLEIILPFHLLGLNGLIGVTANFPEFNDKIGPWTDKLYAVLPAGVQIKTPSPIRFLIKFFFLILRFKDAVCLLCLNNDTSFIAIFFFLTLLLSIVINWRGFIVVAFALDTFFS